MKAAGIAARGASQATGMAMLTGKLSRATVTSPLQIKQTPPSSASNGLLINNVFANRNRTQRRLISSGCYYDRGDLQRQQQARKKLLSAQVSTSLQQQQKATGGGRQFQKVGV
jgi:hypothetical protein